MSIDGAAASVSDTRHGLTPHPAGWLTHAVGQTPATTAGLDMGGEMSAVLEVLRRQHSLSETEISLPCDEPVGDLLSQRRRRVPSRRNIRIEMNEFRFQSSFACSAHLSFRAIVSAACWVQEVLFYSSGN